MVLHYLKFFNFYIAVIFGLAAIALGGMNIVFGFIIYVAFYVLGDALLGDDNSAPALLNHTLLKYMLYSALPLTFVIYFAALWIALPPSAVPLWLSNSPIGDILVNAKASTTWWQILLAVPFLGLMLGGVSTVVAHELVHRIGNPVAVTIGRWLLAFSFDTNFSIEHVFNHHVKVATKDDPATAPRGRNVYLHFFIAFYGTQKAGWHLESKRLSKKALPVISFHNAFIRGWLMSITLLLLSYLLAGYSGAFMFIAVAISAKFTLEIVNYMEHYGLVRDPREPVRPRHSWNSNKKVSCWTMFNLPRHSHHHAQGAVPFEKLKPLEDAPQMLSGYLSTMVVALIPPLWFHIMRKKLADWDKHYANDREREIVAALNEKN